MKQEDKQLLLQNLCAMLPYDVVCHTSVGDYKLLGIDIYKNEAHLDSPVYDEGDGYFDLEYGEVKPYLRTMSSMTEDEKIMFNSIWDNDWDKALTNQIAEAWDRNGFENQTKILEIAACANAINFLIFHHFDYNGLIEKGLAIEAPKDMYNIK